MSKIFVTVPANIGERVGKIDMGATVDPEMERRLLTHDDETLRERYANAKLRSEERLAGLAPPGSFDIPPLLEERRLECAIPNEAFSQMAVFDKILVYQYNRNQTETYLEGGTIVSPESYREMHDERYPRGIIVSAGLQAMDVLHSNGMMLGDYVGFQRNAIWKLLIGHHKNREVRLLMLRIGDIVSDEDLYHRIEDGTVGVEWDPSPDAQVYKLKWKDEERPINPMRPFIGEDQ